MPAEPTSHPADRPSKGLPEGSQSVRQEGRYQPKGVSLAMAILVSAAGLLALRVVAGPSRGGTYGIAAFAAAAVIGALALQLRAARRAQDALAEQLEAFMDRAWERSEAAAWNDADAIPIATVSHEMRAPLHGMLALTDLLAATPLSAEQRAHVAALGQSAGALARLVDDLLDASRIATGQFSLAAAPLDIEPLVEGVAALLAPQAHRRGIGIATRIAPGLPQVSADAGRLRQALVNLATNAIEATERGGVLITVEEADGAGNRETALAFAVHDTGPGVASDDRERIFRSFERARTSGAGLGLGLSISRQIIARMGGVIDVEPRSGGGAVFHFALRLPTIGEDEQRAHPPLNAFSFKDLPFKALPLLVVMPAGLEADALVAALEGAGAETRLAASLSEAAGLVGAAAAAGFRYRVVLVDARMAFDARAALERLRAASGDPIAVVVMVGSEERRPAALLAGDGFDAYLVRPIRRRSLLAVIGEVARLPVGFVADPADREEEPQPPHRGDRPLDVIVVEDDPVSGLLAKAVLERLGHEVSEFGTLAAAQARLARPPHLAVIDLALPDGDGLALIRAFAALGPRERPALIATSGQGGPAIASAVLAAGADLFLEKPVSAERLRRAVAEVSAGRGGEASFRHQTA